MTGRARWLAPRLLLLQRLLDYIANHRYDNFVTDASFARRLPDIPGMPGPFSLGPFAPAAAEGARPADWIMAKFRYAIALRTSLTVLPKYKPPSCWVNPERWRERAGNRHAT
jgi:hypothetical protein